MGSEARGAKKDTAGKPRLDLLPYEALVEIANVFEYGCNKYAEENWREGRNYKDLVAAIMRHTGKYLSGEDLDDESGLHHMAHIATSAMFLLWYHKHNMVDWDNRWGGQK